MPNDSTSQFLARLALVCICLTVGTACSDSNSANSSPTTITTQTSTTEPSQPFTTTPVSTPAESAPATLLAVTTGSHDGFVRVVFRFADAVPGYAVESATPPFVSDGAGEPVEVDGTGFVGVRLIANAHTEEGQPTTPREVTGPGLDVVMLGDFEGVVSWVIGTEGARPFKVFTLQSPPRLVVDIQS